MRILILLLLLVPLASAQTLVDTQGRPVTSGLIRVQTNTSVQESLLNGSIELGSDVPVTILITQGSTFGYAATVTGTMPDTIVVHPVGVLSGEVVDLKENFVADAIVRITCQTEVVQGQTDATGVFREVVPAEECTVAVSKRDRRGSATVVVKQGEMTSVTVSLNAIVAQDASDWGLFAVILLLIAAIIGIALYVRHRPKFTAVEVKRVLKSKEAGVVDALTARGGKASLSELRAATHLPRTSLLRTLESLEARNLVVKREEHGKVILELLK